MIDGANDGRGSYFVASVLNPGSQVRTGAIPDVQPAAFLRGATLEQLRGYRAIYLINVPEISDNTADALYKYVNAGGGLFWLLGSEVNRDVYNRSLASGRRLLPSRLGAALTLPERSSESTGDCVLGAAHPLTESLVPIGDAAFALVAVTQSWSLEADEEASKTPSDAPEKSVVRNVVLRRDGRPLITQHDLGQGRVITSLAGIDPQWTNWAGDPTFVVILLQANAYLWSAGAPQVEQRITDTIARPMSAEIYSPAVTYFPPADEPPRVPVQWSLPTATGTNGETRQAVIDVKNLLIGGSDEVGSLMHVGVAEWSLTKLDGQTEVQPVAIALEAGEGDLQRSDPKEIQRAVRPVDVRFVSAGELVDQYGGNSGSATTLFLLALLALLLAAEQALAYFSSYHSPATVPAVSAAESTRHSLNSLRSKR